MTTEHDTAKPIGFIEAVALFASCTAYGVFIILQAPQFIGQTLSLNLTLSFSKGIASILFAIYAYRMGVDGRGFLTVCGVSILMLILSLASIALSPSEMFYHLLYCILGILTSLGTLTLIIVLLNLPYTTTRNLVIGSWILAYILTPAIKQLATTDSLALEIIAYGLFIASIAAIIAKRRIWITWITPPPPRFVRSIDSGRGKLLIFGIILAIGGEFLFPFTFGLFEPIGLLFDISYLDSLLPSLMTVGATVVLFIILVSSRKGINIEMGFAVICVSYIGAFILILAFGAYFPLVFAFFSIGNSLYFIIVWLYMFQIEKEMRWSIIVLLGFMFGMTVIARILGNSLSSVLLQSTDRLIVISSITPWALVLFCLIILTILIVLLHLHTRDGTESASSSQIDSFADSYSRRLAELSRSHHLTSREAQILEEYATGRSAAAIGEKLYLSVFTVKTHLGHIYTKLNVHSRQELLDRIEDTKT
jgi:DNA-binding CsgD family transcriptional regulator